MKWRGGRGRDAGRTAVVGRARSGRGDRTGPTGRLGVASGRRAFTGPPAGRAVRIVAVGALLAVVVLPGAPGLSGRASAADAAPTPYGYDPEAKRVTGASTTSAAEPLDAGSTYRDSIGPNRTRVYRLNLDAKTNAYVSAVAVPEAGTKVDGRDELSVSVQDQQGSDCGSNDARFGSSSRFPRPLAAYAYRLIDKKAYNCQEAGPYYVVIERTGEATSSAEPWGLEIRHLSEPGLAKTGPTAAPSQWPSASPEPPAAVGPPQSRDGGAGFHDATALTSGEWSTEIEPGGSLFYKIPVDWGQQLFAGAELGSSTGKGFVTGALAMSLYNPARGLVDSSSPVSYDGKQKTTSLDPLPPVAYENRFGFSTGDKDMRFAGWYYLKVSLDPEVGEKFGIRPYGLTLRTNVEGEAKAGPAYDGPAGEFAVTDDDRTEATDGRARNGAMVLVATAALGTGTVLVLGLGVWTLLARRRAVASS
ncbi:hypothetical protein [Streptomyces sp. NRRL F-5135]|uniref:hypothetical protein n=1 Tax=Streptomyces sp. NRRL F-5135 TaxID=1463858 RepID=UPI000AB3DFC4|nr:hypothetical protein [Streptomyces sp. NRRL F-5135]